MNRYTRAGLTYSLALLVALGISASSMALAEAIIIDHNCIDLSQIPPEWIDAAQQQLKLHYGHTSHGSQLIYGLERLASADPTFDAAIGHGELPTQQGALCVYDVDNSPDDYYYDTQSILDSLEALNLSMFGWCCQADYSDWEDYLDDYLANMQAFEDANPDVTFIYMTGNAQSEDQDGYNRYRFNGEIRRFCNENDKVLFDFADLDSWYDGEQHTYRYNRNNVPLEHPHFNGNEAGHTTYESCEQKGRAVWWMMARLAGWNPHPDPSPDIKANHSDEDLMLFEGQPVVITVSLAPGDATETVDFWLCVDTPFGWYSYVNSVGWAPGLERTALVQPFAFADLEVLRLSIPVGDYVFYFAIDDDADGIPTGDFLDYVRVEVN
ncbi:hypothetical protein J7M28_00835 [bacterium]|nr:hypothetical protein [bacterium]